MSEKSIPYSPEMEKSITFLLQALADILVAGGPPFKPALEELKLLLDARRMGDAEYVKRRAFNLSNTVGEVADRVASGAVEVRGDQAAGPAASPEPAFGGDSVNILLSIINHVVSIRPYQYQTEVQELVKMVKSTAAMEAILQKLLDLIIRVRESLWEERSRAFKQIGEILKSLEDTEKDFIGSLSSSQSYLTETDQGFTDAMEDGLKEINELATPGAVDLATLCRQISTKVAKLHHYVQAKRKADQERFEALESERLAAEHRLEKNRRDYEEFSRQSHEMLQEIETLKAVSLYDSLTNVYNRRAYDAQIAKVMSSYSSKTLRTCCLIVFDIDHFREFNNTYGHLAGDRVLAYVARLTRESLRNDDLVFRYGGDEFVILTPNAGLDAALGVAEKVRRNITSVEFKLFKSSDLTVKVTVSMGVAELQPDDDSGSFFSRADQALYRAKTSGRNRVSSCA